MPLLLNDDIPRGCWAFTEGAGWGGGGGGGLGTIAVTLDCCGVAHVLVSGPMASPN